VARVGVQLGLGPKVATERDLFARAKPRVVLTAEIQVQISLNAWSVSRVFGCH
jgi:hypothetical protein